MFRIYKKNKNFVMRVSFILTFLVILSFLNLNNQLYANVNERPDRSNTDTEEKDPKASTDITGPGPHNYVDITYSENVYVYTSEPVTFVNCVFEGNVFVYTSAPVTFINCVFQDAISCSVVACNVTIDLCNLTTIGTMFSGMQLSITNSTLNLLNDYSSVDATGYYELINCTFRPDYSGFYNLDIHHASVYLKNCTTYEYVRFYNENNVHIEDCTFYGELIFDSSTVTAVVRDCKIYDINLPNGDITIQDSEFQRGDIGIASSLNETLELKSNTPNVVLSNFKLVDPLPGEFSWLDIQAGSIFNISDIPKEISSSLYIFQSADSELYVKNSYLATLQNSDGAKVSNIQNCTFIKATIRSNNTVITNCNIYNTLDVDTKNKPFKIENSNFFDVIIHVISGGVDIDNCDFKTEMGLLWLDKDSFALINNSNPRFIWVNLKTSLIAENLVCNSISMRDTSHGIFNNVDVGTMNVIDLAEATIDNCHINSADFESPNVQINNSIVDSMAPTLDAIPSPLNLDNLKDFILNWSAQPGQSLSGNIEYYQIYRAATDIGGAAPSSKDFELIHTIMNPDPEDPLDTKYNDTDLEYPSDLDRYELYYKVEITDAGGNSGNSTILRTAYDTGLVFDVLDATVLFDNSLTTYDDILVSVFMIDADINNNGTQDVGNASLHCQFKYGNTIHDQTIEPTGDSIDGIVYYFLIPQTLTATEITFSIQLEQTSYYDAQGIGLFDFNSTTKYGKKFTIERPTIAFNPVDHPTDDKILVSKRIKLSVSAVSDAQYILSIKVYYRVDGGDWESKSMSYDAEESEYTVKLPEFDPCKLEYYVKYIDIAGNEDELLGSKDDPETIEIIPNFPQTRLEAFDLSMIFVGSALVGIGFGFTYVLLDLNLKKRTSLKRTQKLKAFLDYSDKSKKAVAKKTPAKSTSAKKNVEGK